MGSDAGPGLKSAWQLLLRAEETEDSDVRMRSSAAGAALGKWLLTF